MAVVTIKIPDDLFEEMDRKRFHEKTSFQAVGLEFFVNWVKGITKVPTAPPSTPVTKRGNIPYVSMTGIEDWAGIAAALLAHPKPGLSDALKAQLEQFMDAARLWDGVQGVNAPPKGADQQGGDEDCSEGLGELERLTAEIEQGIEDLRRSGKEAHGKKGRGGKKDSGRR